MKKQFTYIILLLALCTSCSDWLDVRPRNEMKENDMYNVEEGFKNALTGAYIQLASEEVYGKLASYYIPECLAQHWTLSTDKTSEMYNLGNYNYTHSTVEPLIEKMWKKYYQSAVHLNNVYANLKTTGVTFTYDNDKLIEGEILGLRALIHLELLRFFGPAPMSANSGDKAIPYAEEMTKDPNKLTSKSYGEVLEKILRDLNAAEELLKTCDPILRGSNSLLNNPYLNWTDNPEDKPQDEWQFYRQVRFNYYAVLGAKARYYHWIGDKENATKYAKMVITAENRDGTSKFTLANESFYTSTSSNLVMKTEHLFAVHNPDLQSITLDIFKSEKTSLYQSVANIGTAYEKSINPDDIRNKGTRYWEEVTYQNSRKVNHFRKYTGSTNFTQLDLIPILRLAEMYLIVVEDLPLEEAKTFFSTYRIARNLDKSIENKLTDESAVLQILEKEYRKEFYGEGQMFFFYKRHNYKAFTWPKKLTLPAEALSVPIPKSQSVFD